MGTCILRLLLLLWRSLTLAKKNPVVGIGLCFATNAAPLLVTELAYPTQRAPITALYNSSWYLGSIISAWVTFATLKTLTGSTWAWR